MEFEESFQQGLDGLGIGGQVEGFDDAPRALRGGTAESEVALLGVDADFLEGDGVEVKRTVVAEKLQAVLE